MQIYFSPEVMAPDFQVMNIVDPGKRAVGNIAFLFTEKKLYVYGILEEKGVEADFRDLVSPYITGLCKSKPNLEVFTCLYVGADKIELKKEDE